MIEFNVGDTVRRTAYSTGGLTKGCLYEVVKLDGDWITLVNDEGLSQSGANVNFDLVVTNELQVGETYTSNNGNSWVAIYEEDDLVWMKSSKTNIAYPYSKSGVCTLHMTPEFNINWEVTKGPIIEEGVFVGGGYHLSVHPHSLSCTKHKLSVTTVDGIPDWTTLACKEL